MTNLSTRSIYSTLCECEEYFEQRADVDDGIPNKAMSLLGEIREATDKVMELEKGLGSARVVLKNVQASVSIRDEFLQSLVEAALEDVENALGIKS